MKTVVAIAVGFLAFFTLAPSVQIASGSPTVDPCAHLPSLGRDFRPHFTLVHGSRQTELSPEANRILDEAVTLDGVEFVTIQIEPRIRITFNSPYGSWYTALYLDSLLTERARLVRDGLIARGVASQDVQVTLSSWSYRVGCGEDPPFVIFRN